MNRIAKSDAQQSLLSHIEGNEEISNRYLKRLGSEDLIELAISCVELHTKILRSLDPDQQERVYKAFEEWATQVPTTPGPSVLSSPPATVT